MKLYEERKSERKSESEGKRGGRKREREMESNDFRRSISALSRLTPAGSFMPRLPSSIFRFVIEPLNPTDRNLFAILSRSSSFAT